jgi:hypothetical protein
MRKIELSRGWWEAGYHCSQPEKKHKAAEHTYQ